MTYSRLRDRRTESPQGGFKVGRIKQLDNGNLVTEGDIFAPPVQVPRRVERCWDELHGKPPYNTGGPFSMYRILSDDSNVSGKGAYNSKGKSVNPLTYREYNGGFTNPVWPGVYADAAFTAPVTIPTNSTTFPDLTSFGATAYDKLRPQIPKAGLGVFIAELRDLPGMLRTTSEGFHNLWKSIGGGSATPFMHPKSVADQFLNHQFGWAPFIGDIGKFIDVYRHSDDYVRKIMQNNDRWVKRSRTIDETESITRIGQGFVSGVSPQGIFYDQMCRPMVVSGTTCNHYFEVWDRVSTRIWAEGSFKYYRPEFDLSLRESQGLMGDLNRLITLYGARINPSVLYRAAPWTWAADWFSNTGHLVDHVTDILFDGVASRYCYVMRKRVRTGTFSQISNFWSGAAQMHWTRVIETKQRQSTDSPFSFTLSANLTARQVAIAAALGVSRS